MSNPTAAARPEGLTTSCLVEQVSLRWRKIMIVLGCFFVVVLTHLLVTKLLSDPPNWLQGELLTFWQAVIILAGLVFFMFIVLGIRHHHRTREQLLLMHQSAQVSNTTHTDASGTRAHDPTQHADVTDPSTPVKPAVGARGLWHAKHALAGGFAAPHAPGKGVSADEASADGATPAHPLLPVSWSVGSMEDEINGCKVQLFTGLLHADPMVVSETVDELGITPDLLADLPGGPDDYGHATYANAIIEQWLAEDLARWHKRVQVLGDVIPSHPHEAGVSRRSGDHDEDGDGGGDDDDDVVDTGQGVRMGRLALAATALPPPPSSHRKRPRHPDRRSLAVADSPYATPRGSLHGPARAVLARQLRSQLEAEATGAADADQDTSHPTHTAMYTADPDPDESCHTLNETFSDWGDHSWFSDQFHSLGEQDLDLDLDLDLDPHDDAHPALARGHPKARTSRPSLDGSTAFLGMPGTRRRPRRSRRRARRRPRRGMAPPSLTTPDNAAEIRIQLEQHTQDDGLGHSHSHSHSHSHDGSHRQRDGNDNSDDLTDDSGFSSSGGAMGESCSSRSHSMTLSPRTLSRAKGKGKEAISEDCASTLSASSTIDGEDAEAKPSAEPEPEPEIWYGPLRTTLVGVGDMILNDVDKGTRAFENDHFEGTMLVRVRDAIGAPQDSYFEGKNRVFSVLVEGRFKYDVSGNDILYGASFSKPIVFPRGFSLGVRFASCIDPGLRIDWKTDTPSFLSPLLTSMNEAYGPGLEGMGASERRKHFKKEDHRLAFTFLKDTTYRFEIYGNVMNWATFDVAMGPFKMNAIRFMNEQPIRLQASSVSSGAVFFALEFDHKRLHPDIYPDEQ